MSKKNLFNIRMNKKEYIHKFLIVELNGEYSTKETHVLASAIMLLEKVISVQLAKKVKRIK